jgi:putative transposase
MLQQRLGMSQRRACRALGQPRSTQRYQPPRPDPDAQLRCWLREFSRQRPRWGYRRAHVEACRAGYRVNRKKVQRLWREEGLRVPTHRRKRARLGTSTVPAERRCAERPNQVWAVDFQFDTTTDGRLFKILNIVDEHTREALACHVARSIDADATVNVLDTIAAGRGYPEFIRCDNGPELTAHAIRDWCRASGAGTVYIDPGAPWQNPWVESFNARMRDELLAVEQFDSLLEAKVLVDDWRIDYNLNRPHSSLGYLAPATYATTCTKPKLS